MENNNKLLIIAPLSLVVGLGIGLYLGTMRPAPQPAADTQMHGAMDQMTVGLAGKTGAALEEAFLDEMIVHHEGAIEMAQTLLRGTQRPELIKLGNDIVTAQTGEIEQMKQWRKDWFGR
jgi:uncharacterized protein (DUF305 family)